MCTDSTTPTYIARIAWSWPSSTEHNTWCTMSWWYAVTFARRSMSSLTCGHMHQHVYSARVTRLHLMSVDAQCGLYGVHPARNVIDTEACMCRVCPNITMCVHVSIGSRNRTIHNVFHISLHVSSSIEPTHQSRHVWNNTHICSMEHNGNVYCWWSTRPSCICWGHIKHCSRRSMVVHATGSRRRTGINHRAHFTTGSTTLLHHMGVKCCTNDPSAGSPTETLLRLLLPLSDKVH